MAIELIANYLKETTGLDSHSIGMPVVAQAVNKRIASRNAESFIEYYKLLLNSKNELNLLIDQVMVPETWFFRGEEAFDFLREQLVNRATCKDQSKIRILSIPCATGEEPYSIAIVLKECGYTSDECVIDAIDIANESLVSAKKALFTEHSFRGSSPHTKQRYFKKTDHGYKLAGSIKKMVNFSHGNLFEMAAGENEKYDIVFCRNLLIYFDKNTQYKALNKLYKLLSDKGILFIGHGEAGCTIDSQFEKIDRPNTFAFSKKQHKKIQQTRAITAPKKKKTILKNQNPRNAKTNIEKKVNTEKPTTCDTKEINEAIKMANEGKLDDAMKKCKKAIESGCVSADALYLLGVIQDAKNNRQEAENYYKRAIHLMPDHYQSLMHLASHAERQGNIAKSVQYRSRAKKITHYQDNIIHLGEIND